MTIIATLEVLTAVLVLIQDFWDVARCPLKTIHGKGERGDFGTPTCYFRLQEYLTGQGNNCKHNRKDTPL